MMMRGGLGALIEALQLLGYFPGGGGSGTPGGSSTQLQYNNAGAFGGIAGSTWAGGVLTLPSLTTPGGMSVGIKRITANYTMTNDDSTIVVDATAGAITLTFPPSPNNGQKICVKLGINAAGNTLTMNPNGFPIDNVAGNMTSASTTKPNFEFQFEGAGRNIWWIV